jgi:DnaJ-class molecular chaperone
MNYYDLLGIESGHPQEGIPQAFRMKIKQVHPDKVQLGQDATENKDATIKLY